MIRTTIMNLKVAPTAAYRQKLPSGGLGLVIISENQRAAFTIDRRSGKCIPYAETNSLKVTSALLEEALTVTRGLPFKKGKKPIYPEAEKVSAESETSEDSAFDTFVVDSAEYRSLLAKYTDKSGVFSYQLMNKDMIQFANRSNVVAKMIEERNSVDEIVEYIVRNKIATLSKNKELSKTELIYLIDFLDCMNIRSAFKELKAHIRLKLRKK